ncbi:D-glycero-beta-D-manno-heptose 1-phosphate adenylyltransferase [Desulfovibrio ferrophilus]|uniref:D-glycero-beta-D-manno-heptose 1-phosphate adenylyltransferase n=1 Tax=Desulfovibrio ferrophilus TaxID=241368 RepID=A0A2Z6AUJ7_9BACT|nr:D-glycero-beta-D-manno-heptose 1-phosphate adenylyltransferase [Desulfovibrio ferrophilus]BBD06890.1 rfaE bifunctional protein [Desulfovibrio ferrophilus]
MNAPRPHSDKIVERSRLAVLFATLREAKRIVFTNGCFDILHPGHVDLLARCRALGDALVVGVNDDASVRRLNKIPPRPLNPLDHRMAVLAGLESVSFVTSFSEDTPLELITELKPHVLVKGGDWSLENIVGREVVQAHGGEVHSLPLLPGYSTTVLIEKILKLGK